MSVRTRTRSGFTATLGGLVGRCLRDSMLRNSLYIMATTVMTAGTGFIYWAVAAHFYQATVVGINSALISALTLTSTVAAVGFGPALVDALPRCTTPRARTAVLSGTLLTAVTISSAAAAAAMAVIPRLSRDFALLRHDPALLVLLFVGIPLWSLSATIDYVYLAERSSGNGLARNTAFAVAKLLLLLVPVILQIRFSAGIMFSWVAGCGLSYAMGWLLVKRLGLGYGFSLRHLAAGSSLRRGSVIGQHVIAIGGTLPMYVLPIVVTVRLSAASNAYFYTTWMLGGVFFLVSPAIAAALFAEGAYDDAALHELVGRAALLTGAVLIPLIGVAILFSRQLLLLFGPEYGRHGQLMLTLLALSAVPDAITSLYISVLRIRGRLKAASVLNLGMAAIAIAVAWVGLPHLGIAAGGWAWIAAQTIGTGFVVLHARATRAPTPTPVIVRCNTTSMTSNSIVRAAPRTGAATQTGWMHDELV